MHFLNFYFFTKFAHVDKILAKIDIVKNFCLAFRMSKMILYIFDNVGLAKISKSVREFLQKDTKNDPRAHDSKLTRRVKYAHAAELLSELEKRALRVIF